ncbi:MAG: virulence factor Mce family protein [Nocardioides sp.]|nr:virulence factor Mce family protein [Nocardioides sp.]
MNAVSRAKALLLLLVGSVLLSGCNFDVYKLPLPGGTDVGSNPITVTVQFHDVLDLVPKSTVKVNDVSVGQVTDIKLDGYTADVTLELRNDTLLPDNALAEIRQTSLLGEKFVALSAPTQGASAEPLQTGDTIPLEHSGNNPEVEEVLGALSLLLNGGGVAQLKTIATELNKTLEGREDSAKSVLTQIASFAQQLDDNKVQIVNAIESLNKLALNVHAQQGIIDSALDQLPSALASLDSQRADLVKMLQSLNQLGDVGVRVIKASKASTIESIQQLQPVLTELANSGDDFVKAFNVFLTYPFVDEVVGRDPQVARNLHMGDYTNLSIQLDLDLTGSGTSIPTLPTNLPTIIDPTVILGNVLKCLRSGDLTSKSCKKVLATPGQLLKLRSECQKAENRNKDVCKQLNLLPGLPSIPGLPDLGGVLGGVLGLPRAAFGPTASWSKTRGPTLRQLTQVFDPALVNLLIPGMVAR